jgi:hypothetical protein
MEADDIVVDGATEAVAAAVGVESEKVIAILVGFADPQFADDAAFDQRFFHCEALPAVRRLWRSLRASSTTERHRLSATINVYIAMQQSFGKPNTRAPQRTL